MFKELLPIGSVIILRGGVKKLMITGIKTALKVEPEKAYDYVGVLYPEGFLGEQGNFLFNHGDINDIIFTGYTNPEREEFLEFLEAKAAEDTMDKSISAASDTAAE